MGEVPHEVKRTPGVAARASSARNQTLLKERSDMDSLTSAQHQEKFQRSPFHILHVYRHVDSEKVECSPLMGLIASKSLASRPIARSPLTSVLHGVQSSRGNHALFGGAQCSC